MTVAAEGARWRGAIAPASFLRQAVENLQQGVDDCLAKGIGRGSDLLVTLVARRQTEVAAFLCNDRLCPLYCPLC